jgi:hypothetical protein
MPVAQKHQDELKKIKESIQEAHDYFQPNYKSYHENRRFVFLSSLTTSDIDKLEEMGKPTTEFNVLESYISRLRGEFSKQEPSILVSRDSDAADQLPDGTEKLVEGYMRHIFQQASKDGCQYGAYTDSLAGGFFVLKVGTKYIHERAFSQVITLNKVEDPTLCGFDPLASEPHKGDGRFCFEIFPKREDEFKEEYPNIDIDDIDFVRSVDGFSWSYTTKTNERILLIVDFYKKKKTKTKLVQLSTGELFTSKEYAEHMKEWEESGVIEQAPIIINERTTEITKICRYRMIGNKVIEYEVTDFKYLPLIFGDGNSVKIRESDDGGALQQYTRPYFYHAKGTQRLKNFAGQCLGNELENSVQHKFLIAEESIPERLIDVLTKPQVPNNIPYKSYTDGATPKPLPPPQLIQRPPIPAEFAGTFMATDQTIQGILGSYDAALGINNNQLSGVAIVEGATQSNSAAMPFVVSYMHTWSQAAKSVLDLIPKYIVTPRTIPIIGDDGQRSYVEINKPDTPSLRFSENALQIEVEAGVNFSIQKHRALQQITAMMQASPLFAKFMNSEGLGVLLDNMEMRGSDRLQAMVKDFVQKQKQLDAQQQQQNPLVAKQQLEVAKLRAAQQENQSSNALRAAEIEISRLKAQTDRLATLLKMTSEERNRLVQMAKNQTQKEGQAVELAVEAADTMHNHRKDVIEMSKTALQAQQQQMPRSQDEAAALPEEK